MINSTVTSVVYLVLSLVVLTSLYFLSRFYSGERFKWRWFFICLSLTILFGSFHMSTVKYGYDLIFPALKPILQNNDAVGWIAFVSIFLHTCCVPTQYEPKRWFSRKKTHI